MRDHPILFSASMVRALLNGSKTQTRRIMKVQPPSDEYKMMTCIDTTGDRKNVGRHHWARLSKNMLSYEDNDQPYFSCPYGYNQDQLWVRETFCPDWCDKPIYKADGGSAIDAGYSKEPRWKPSIHMPRWASRITLEITGIRVERLNDCSKADAIAEGIEGEELFINGISEGGHYRDYILDTDDMCEWFTNPIYSYQSLWESINGAGSWATNPWVWVVEFKVVKP
jgi:hypothetical protein